MQQESIPDRDGLVAERAKALKQRKEVLARQEALQREILRLEDVEKDATSRIQRLDKSIRVADELQRRIDEADRNRKSLEMLQDNLNKHWDLVDSAASSCKAFLKTTAEQVVSEQKAGKSHMVLSLQGAYSSLVKSWMICQVYGQVWRVCSMSRRNLWMSLTEILPSARRTFARHVLHSSLPSVAVSSLDLMNAS